MSIVSIVGSMYVYDCIYIYIVGSDIHPFFPMFMGITVVLNGLMIYIYTIPINITFVGNVANEMP